MSSCNPCDDNISIILDTGSQGPQGPVGPIADVFNYEFVLLAGDTIISGTDNSGKDFTYNPNSLQVHVNGVLLSATDYTATDGTSIVLNEAAANNNDLAQISTQVKPEGSDDIPSEIDRIDGEIADLDARVTTNEGNIQDNADAIAGMQETAQNFTTRDVKVSGVSPTRGRGDELETQQDINLLHDGEILSNTARIETLEAKEPDVSTDDLDGIKEDVADNSQGISDNAQAISDLLDVVEINSTDIEGLQGQIDKLPPPTDISDLEDDVDDLVKQVGSNTIAIAKNTADIAALPEMTIDLEPLNDAIADNAAGVAKNASDILGLKATDAKHTGEIADLQTAVGHLEAIDIPDNYAVVDDDNEFQVPQTIKDGVKLTGSDAFIECDTGTPLQVKNGNFSNSVVDIIRSNGDVAISLEASGHIRKLATDPTDPTSAVNVEFVQDLIGDADHTHDTYATKVELKTEEQARILGDQALDAKIDALEPYDDSKIKRDLQAETDARIAGDRNLQSQIDVLAGEEIVFPEDLVDEDRLSEVLQEYATEEYVTDAIADFSTEDFVESAVDGLASEEYVDDAVSEGTSGLATETFVTEGDAATLISANEYADSVVDGLASEDFVTSAIADQASDQALVDEDQNREIEELESRVSQIESVSLDAKYLFEGDAQVPRDGEFTALVAGMGGIAETWEETAVLYFAENAMEGKPDWSAVSAGDVIRLGGSSAGIILPTKIDSRNADSFAEFKVTNIPSERMFEVELIRSASTPLAGVEYGVLLLSSFDPSGLATTDYVNEQLAKKYDKSGGEITGTVNVTGGTLKITKNELKIEKNDGTNAFRVQPETQVTFNVPTRMNEPLDMKDNKIIGCGPADPERGHDVVNVDFLNEAIGTIETNVGDAVLSANQDWTGTNKFKGVTHFESSMVTRAGTWIELQGDADNVQNRYFKIRANADLRFYSYPGQNNTGARNCFSILHAPGEAYPVVTLNYLSDPTANGNPVNLRYANNTYLKKEDYVEPQALTPIVFKTDQYVRAYAGKGPPAGYASFINAPEPGGQSNSNQYFGNCNYGIQVAYDKLKNSQGEEFASGESYNVSGYVSVYGKEDHKLYFKAPVVRVHRPSGQNYISITFPGDKGWIPAATFGTGSTSDQNYFAVIVEAYQA